MKKLLIPILVLGIAGMASAGLIFTMNEDVLTIEGEDVFGFLLEIKLVDVGADMGTLQLDTSNITFPTPFDLPGRVQNIRPDGLYYELMVSNIFGGPESGVMVDGITWTGQGVADLVVIFPYSGLAIWPGHPVGELYRYHIPEPASMVLLGLGTLLVRRRR
ncbi:MAG: PEP-CTERM sorting domain-containing protein [Sedimentisphaerales bacterium]|nr:PEP-CTERM sorting domain-containing protein [Sedimentisphaerales bacterium]